jgi:hypothetical protein
MNSDNLYTEEENPVGKIIPYDGALTVDDLLHYEDQLRKTVALLNQRTHTVGRELREAAVRELGDPAQHLEDAINGDVPPLVFAASNYPHYASASIVHIAPMSIGDNPRPLHNLKVFSISVSWRENSWGGKGDGTLEVDVSTEIPRRHGSHARSKFPSKAAAVAGFPAIYKRALKNFKKGYYK